MHQIPNKYAALTLKKRHRTEQSCSSCQMKANTVVINASRLLLLERQVCAVEPNQLT